MSAMSDTIQLNLVAEKPTKEAKKRVVVSLGQTDDDGTSEPKRPRFERGDKSAAVAAAQKTDSQNGPQQQSGEFISSLFNHNPEIPQLDLSSTVLPVQEAVFTSRSFDEVGIHPHLVKNLSDLGMPKMTNVQSKAIPVIMAGKDVLVKSQVRSAYNPSEDSWLSFP